MIDGNKNNMMGIIREIVISIYSDIIIVTHMYLYAYVFVL